LRPKTDTTPPHAIHCHRHILVICVGQFLGMMFQMIDFKAAFFLAA
jgi:hypothetical protein